MRQYDVRIVLRDPGVRVDRPLSAAHPAEAETAVFEFIERWYNSRRRHSALDMMSPIEYESSHPGVARDTSPDLSAETG
jgi:transposase InsO family protein